MFVRFYDLTFITDAFTKRIIGYCVSKYLTTETKTLAALQMAIKTPGKERFTNLSLHADGGGQNYDKAFLKLTNIFASKTACVNFHGKITMLTELIELSKIITQYKGK